MLEKDFQNLVVQYLNLKGKGLPAHKIGKQWKFKCTELDVWVKSGKSAIE